MRHRTTPALLIAVVLALIVMPAAFAAGSGGDGLGGGVGGTILGPTGSGTGTGGDNYSPTTQQPNDAQMAPVTQPTDSPGHDTSVPDKPDHAGGSIADVNLGGNSLVVVGDNNASANDDGTTNGDATVLSLLGQEIIGSHANCDSSNCDDSGSVVPKLLCEETQGSICVGLLFADTSASTHDDSSSASADQALVYACVGGDQTSPEANCDGLVGAGVGENHSHVHQDNNTGATDADQVTDVADVCVGPTGEDPTTGTCSGLGVSALHSQSHSSSDSQNGPGSTEASSYVLQVELGGQVLLTVQDPTAISLPPDCPPGVALLCVFLNQGESAVYTGGAQSHAEALHVSVLRAVVGGEDLVEGHVSDAETLAEDTGPACPPGSTRSDCVPTCPAGQFLADDGTCQPNPKPPGPKPHPRGLAFTGSDVLVPIAVALILMLAGSTVLAWDRRREIV